MPKKKLIIVLSIIGIIIIAGGVTLALVLTRAPKDEPEVVVLTPICSLIPRDTIASAIGVESDTLGDAIDQGEVNDQDGKTRTCFYKLGAKANALYSNVTITATTFKNEEKRANAVERFNVTTKPKTVDGLVTYFSSLKTTKALGNGPVSSVPAQTSYKLYVFKDSKVYTYGIVTPSDRDLFKDKEAAEKALASLVHAANL